jgi:ABC-type multidrug transport system ATPase subunit
MTLLVANPCQKFWNFRALNNVSFLFKGSIFDFIQNGAGKTTLMSTYHRMPDEGSCSLDGQPRNQNTLGILILTRRTWFI